VSDATPISRDNPTTVGSAAFQSFSSQIHVEASALSHPGRVRTNNEDQFLIAKLTRSLETMQTSLKAGEVPERADEVNHVFVVADGMGGHAAGEVASRMAISNIVKLALQLPDWIFRVDEEHVPEMEWRARRLVQQVSTMLVERGRQEPAMQGMGTTLTAARSLGRDLMVVHVGDSRAYLFRGGQLRRLTRDHTYAQVLADTGLLAAGDAADSRLRHILTNALGGSDGHVEADIDMVQLEDGDRLLLCSDGLTDLVDDETIAKTLAQIRVSSEACAELVRLALDRGGRDNVTVLVAAYTLPAERSSSTSA
jgi:serine/threonine protein phosphatase PrpC